LRRLNLISRRDITLVKTSAKEEASQRDKISMRTYLNIDPINGFMLSDSIITYYFWRLKVRAR